MNAYTEGQPTRLLLTSAGAVVHCGSAAAGQLIHGTSICPRQSHAAAFMPARTIQCRISSMRPMQASRVFFMSWRFCGCSIWSYAVSSFRKICRYLM